jgi:hypothetical protein
MKEEFKTTTSWDLYEIGRNYNRRQNMYTEGKENYDYYHGRQWEGIQKPKSQAEPITMNIVKPIVKYKVGIVNQNSYEIVFNPNSYSNEEELQLTKDVSSGLTQFVNRMWEKSQSGKIVRSIVKNACINAEGIMYFYNEGDDILSEEIDKNNIYYGNENSADIQEQPYILVTYRKPVKEIKQRARDLRDKGYNNLSDEDINSIVSDLDYEEQQGKEFMQQEVSPMCLVIKRFERLEDGKIWVSESTKTCDLIEPQTTKCELYPFAHFLWEEEKGYARGVSEVRGVIDNQREINKTATRRAIAVKLGAYPKLVVATDFVKNKDALSQVGSTIEVNGMRADDVHTIATYLNPAQISPDAYNLQADLITNTRELAGAGDTATGNIDPQRSSGKAILAIQQASQQPLNEQLENFKYFLEDCAKVIFELIKVYFIKGLHLHRTIEEYNELGNVESYEEPFNVTKKQLEKIDVNLKIDITPTTAFDRYAQELSLENLLLKGLINLEEYTEALPEGSAMPKPTLESIIQRRKEARAKIAELQQQMNAMQSAAEQVIMENEGHMMGGYGDEMRDVSEGGNESFSTFGGPQEPEA